ncbi:MAG: aldehyde dehydrogenase family protein [Bacteroidota bacterium]
MNSNPQQFPTWWQDLQRSNPILAAENASERIQRLMRLRKAILESEEAIRQALHADLGKPAMETNLTELLPVYNEIKHFKANLHRWMRNRNMGPHFPYLLSSGHIQYQAKGCVLLIAPWNYPFQLAVMPLIAAIAAGNTVVVKPSEHAPTTTALLAELVPKALGEDVVKVIAGDGQVGAELLKLPFDHILFTGGERVGKIVAQSAAAELIPYTLELGGKSPVYVDESAPLEATAAKVYWGKWLNGGQTCIAPDYLLMNRSMVPLMAEAFRGAASKVQEGEQAGGPSLCQQIHAQHADRIRDLLQDALAGGARIEVGGRWDDQGLHLEPTVLSGVTPGMRLMNEEIFGPILPIVGVDHLEEALAFVRSRPKPLALYVFARNPKVMQRWAMESSSGSMCLNDVVIQISHPDLPLGGVGASGSGSYHGRYGFETFSHARAVLRNPHWPNLTSFFYPPYTPFKAKLAGWLMRWMR